MTDHLIERESSKQTHEKRIGVDKCPFTPEWSRYWTATGKTTQRDPESARPHGNPITRIGPDQPCGELCGLGGGFATPSSPWQAIVG
jgi:hypothetical protein